MATTIIEIWILILVFGFGFIVGGIVCESMIKKSIRKYGQYRFIGLEKLRGKIFTIKRTINETEE